MLAVPPLSPVTIPEPGNTDATSGLPVLHVPPSDKLANTVLLPTQVLSTPTNASGRATVVSMATADPQPVIYEIIVVPADKPAAKIPVEEPIVATGSVLLTHVPPASASDKVVPPPAHCRSVPIIAGGNGFTVTTVVTAHPKTV